LAPDWVSSRVYDGNPDTHPKLKIPEGIKVIRATTLCRHHAHFAVGNKANDQEIAKQSITGWPHGKEEVYPQPWPHLLENWRCGGHRPSEVYA
jgi:hypothetical protein